MLSTQANSALDGLKGFTVRLLSFPYHPLLFALIPVMLYAGGAQYFQSALTALPMATYCVFGVLLLDILLCCVTRSMRKGAALASICTIWFFWWQPFYKLSLAIPLPTDLQQEIALALYALLLIVVIVLFLRGVKDMQSATICFNLVATSLAFYNLGVLVQTEYKVANLTRPYIDAEYRKDSEFRLNASRRPDIYYIILDAYARHDTLAELYKYDNSELLEGLKQRGFVIADKSCSNYSDTSISIPSSLNLEYHDMAGAGKDQLTRAYRTLSLLFGDSRIARLLRANGYKIVNVSSGFDMGEHLDGDVTNVSSGLGTWFDLDFLEETTALGPTERWTGWLRAIARHKRLTFFDNVNSIVSMPGPKFVFVHVFLPHAPFLFDEFGDPPKRTTFSVFQYWFTDLYRAQAQFLREPVIKAVDTIVDKDPDSIIIIQSDHGPECILVDRSHPTEVGLKERMRILNAYRVPPSMAEQIYPKITPVNSFRLLLNSLFGTRLPLLPDRSFYSTFEKPTQFRDVTDVVN